MGLENSKIFTILMISGVVIISSLLIFVTYARGSTEAWTKADLLPQGLSGVRLILLD
jgi:hypothetical protein